MSLARMIFIACILSGCTGSTKVRVTREVHDRDGEVVGEVKWEHTGQSASDAQALLESARRYEESVRAGDVATDAIQKNLPVQLVTGKANVTAGYSAYGSFGPMDPYGVGAMELGAFARTQARAMPLPVLYERSNPILGMGAVREGCPQGRNPMTIGEHISCHGEALKFLIEQQPRN